VLWPPDDLRSAQAISILLVPFRLEKPIAKPQCRNLQKQFVGIIKGWQLLQLLTAESAALSSDDWGGHW
jgi:hypothetical protein